MPLESGLSSTLLLKKRTRGSGRKDDEAPELDMRVGVECGKAARVTFAHICARPPSYEVCTRKGV